MPTRKLLRLCLDFVRARICGERARRGRVQLSWSEDRVPAAAGRAAAPRPGDTWQRWASGFGTPARAHCSRHSLLTDTQTSHIFYLCSHVLVRTIYLYLTKKKRKKETVMSSVSNCSVLLVKSTGGSVTTSGLQAHTSKTEWKDEAEHIFWYRCRLSSY